MIGAVVVVLVRGILRPQPDNPFEAAQLVEGWRASRGLPLYEDPILGHATHMYGALTSYLLGAVFRLAGSGVWVGRALELVAAISIVVLLCSIVLAGAHERDRGWLVPVVVSMSLGVDLRVENYFVQNRPDMVALLAGLLGLICWYRGHARRNPWIYSLGVVFFVVGFFLKQPVAALGLIPLIAIALEEGWAGSRRWLLLAALPMGAIAGAVAALRAFAPLVFFYMVTVPGKYHISGAAIIDGLAMVLVSFPLFILCATQTAFAARSAREIVLGRGKLWLWTVVSVAVLVPPSVLALAKAGGALNSLLPAMFAITVFCGLSLREWLPPLIHNSRSLGEQRRVALIMAGLLLLTYPRVYGALGFVPSYADYDDVVASVALLRGHRVASPEDGTITVAALGEASQSAYLRYDAAAWDPASIKLVKKDLSQAEFVVDVTNWWQDLIDAKLLTSLGFEPVRRFRHYTIWHRHGGVPAAR